MSVTDFLRGFFNPKPDDVAGRSMANGERSLNEGKRDEDARAEQRRRDREVQEAELRRGNQARIDRNLGPATRAKGEAERNAERSRDEAESARLVANANPTTTREPLRGRPGR